MVNIPDLQSIAEQFEFPGEIKTIQACGSGLINDTFEVVFSSPATAVSGRTGKRAIMQRINRQVFPRPIDVMRNLEIILNYVHVQHTADNNAVDDFLFPTLYMSQEGASYVTDPSGDVWRAMTFIENTISVDVLSSMEQAYEAGYALGAFHQRLQGIAADDLHDTLPGFHITPEYLEQYDQVLQRTSVQAGLDKEETFCRDAIGKNRDLANVLVNASPALATRVMHGDPKLNNILFDEQTGKAVSLIDLDTVKPGLVHYDIADCLRSCCNRSGELPSANEVVEFDIDVCRAILDGYFTSAKSVFIDRDFDFLYPAIMLLPFELGLRFYTDYLSGNQYFKVNEADDNLRRAMTQFRLLLSIQAQEKRLQTMVLEMKRKLEY